MKVIVFPNDGTLPDLPNDRLRIATFIGTADQTLAYAARIVPTGVPFLITDSGEVPEDRTFRNAWTADFSKPDGYGGQE